jgi:hypothetical protein
LLFLFPIEYYCFNHPELTQYQIVYIPIAVVGTLMLCGLGIWVLQKIIPQTCLKFVGI